jgi:hypothetical protein
MDIRGAFFIYCNIPTGGAEGKGQTENNRLNLLHEVPFIFGVSSGCFITAALYRHIPI